MVEKKLQKFLGERKKVSEVKGKTSEAPFFCP